MIQHIKFEGRSASAAFLDDGFKPVDKAEATIVKVCFTDERGGVVFLTAAPIDDNEVEAARRKQQWQRAKERAQDTLARVWDESKHPREPSGSSAGGEFAHGGGGDGDSGKTESADKPKPANNYNYGLVPGDAAKFKALKGEWAKVNNELLAYVDNPDGPESQARMDKLESIVKEMHGLRADPGGAAGIGLPGGPRDVTIVGAGPGGLNAGINGAAEGLDTLIIEANVVAGGQAKYSSRIENFPGFPVGVTGEKLTQNMFEQASRLGAETKLGVRVTGLTYDESTGLKHLTLSNGETIESRTVILAGGLEFRRLPFDGSEGPGVIVGDGKALAKAAAGGRVVVVGGSNGAAQAALGCAPSSEHVYLLSRGPITDSMSDYQIEALRANPKVTVIESDSIVKLWRDQHGNPEKIVTASGKTLPVKAVGVFVGSVPNTKWLPASVQTAKGGRILTDHHFETALPGIYAVGDMREGAIGRVGVAAGDGQFALREANAFLIKQQEEEKAKKKKDKAVKPERPAKPKAATEKEKAVSRELIADLFDLDRDNAWFGQTAENVTPLKTPGGKAAKKKSLLADWRSAKEQSRRLLDRYWDESKHPREPAGSSEGGQFADAGGGGYDYDAGYEFVSPNVRSDLDFKGAVQALDSDQQKSLRDASRHINRELNHATHEYDIIGAWADGAENSVMGITEKGDWDKLVLSASMKGHLADQKSVLVFQNGEGNSALYSFKVNGDLKVIHEQLLQQGLAFHTLVPRAGGAQVYVVDRDLSQTDIVKKAANGAEITTDYGRAEFVGTEKEDGTDREQRDDARRAYEENIKRSPVQGAESLWQGVRDRWGTSAGQAASVDSSRRAGESDKEFAKRVVDKRPVPDSLPEKHDQYFNMKDNTKVVPVDKITPSKGADVNKISGENAAKRMAAATSGELAKRDPITVQETDDGYVVVDGNGTLTAVKMYGWKGIPVTVYPNPRKDMTRGSRSANRQPVKSLNELYARARAAEPGFKKEVEAFVSGSKGGTVHYQSAATSEPGTNLKNRASAEDKMRRDKTDATEVFDVMRATVIHDTVEETRAAVAKFIGEKGDRILRVKDRYYDPNLGYRDALVNFRTEDGLTAEVIFGSDAVLQFKSGRGHAIYKQIATLREGRVQDPSIAARVEREIAALERESESGYVRHYLEDGNGVYARA